MTIGGFCGKCGRACREKDLERRALFSYVNRRGALVKWLAVLCKECSQSALAWEVEQEKAMILLKRMGGETWGGKSSDAKRTS